MTTRRPLAAEAAEPVAEAEIKLEITAEAFAAIARAVEAHGFTATGEEEIVDHYLAYQASEIAGFEFTRLRVVDGRSYLLTEKRWTRDAEGHPVRLEEERPLSPIEFGRLLPPDRVVPCLAKRRRNFRGMIDDLPAVISLDRLELPGRTRHFVECEVLTTPERSRETRERLVAWARANLPVGSAPEAPSMLQLVLEG
jgi:adenylate cyclase class IV